MKQKNYHLLKAWLYAISALFILSLPLWIEIGNNGGGYPLLIILCAFFGYMSFKHFKYAKTSREEDRAYAPPADANTQEQISFYRRYLYISLIAFPVLSLIVISDLNDLEKANGVSIRVWAPVAFLYEQYGYWPAVVFVPALWCVVILLFIKKIYSLKSI